MPAPYLPTRELSFLFKGGGAALTPVVGWFQLVQQSFFKGDPQGAFLRWGEGSPETVVTAPVGSLFLRTDGGASTTMYVKESGTGNTGWRAV